MQVTSRVYACGSNLHQQIQQQSNDGEPLLCSKPVLLSKSDNGLNATEVIALSASQVLFNAAEGPTSTGFANDDAFIQETLKNRSNVRTFLGRDVFKAYMTTDGQIHLPGQRRCSNKFSHAAMDGHGRILAVTFEAKLRLYNSSDDLDNDTYTEVALHEKVNLSNATIHGGGAHFIVFAKQEHGHPIILGYGDNRFFQQAHDHSASSKEQVRRVDFFDEGTSPVIKIECGDLHTAFLTEDGALYMSGSNVKGQCGGFSEQEPSLVIFGNEEEDIDVLDVACGATHTVALTNEGVYVAGSNNAGQLGTGNTVDRVAFTRMPLQTNTNEKATRVHAAGWNTFVSTEEVP